MLEHLNRKKVLRAKILMQNALKRQIPAMCRVEVLRACVIKYRKIDRNPDKTKHSHSTTFCNIYSTNKTRVHKLQ